jgi:hypothetical protein
MHQRRTVQAGAGTAAGAACCDHHHHGCDDKVSVSSSSSAPPPPFMKKRRKRRGYSHPLAHLFDEDWMIALIQIVSVILLMGCGVALLGQRFYHSHFFHQLARLFAGPLRPGERYPMYPLSPSSYYTVPESMSHIGDKSDAYALLRKDFDAQALPDIPQQFHLSPLPMQHSNSDQVPYDIYNCPDSPPEGYPFDWTLLDVLAHWPPDDPHIPVDHQIHQGLCVFDYAKDYDKAVTYRTAELPFVVTNDPAVKQAVQRWNAPNYMSRMLGTVLHRAEYSENNHFLYWNMPPSERKRKEMEEKRIKKNKPLRPWNGRAETPVDWKEPTKMIKLKYEDWLAHANVTDESMLGPDQPHWYFRLIGCGETGPEGQCDAGSSEYLFDELTFFQPKPSLYIVEPAQQKGIHCRFGMKGVIAENHFDGSRNAIVVLGGERRYVLSHPNQCENLSLLPRGHPSARHSAVDWSHPDLEAFPEFAKAKGNEVVLQAGDVLYLPTNWFHYIVSLSLNFQCNTRSGVSPEYMPPIHECGF